MRSLTLNAVLLIDIEIPVIISPFNDQQLAVYEKTDITFTCTAAGSPTPSIYFIYEGIILTCTNDRPLSIAESLMERVNLGSEVVAIHFSTGLHEVTRNLTIFDAVDRDTGKFICATSASIPKIGVTSENVSFSLLIYCKLY